MKKEFKFGTCTVPDGKKGPWTIDTFTIPKNDPLLFMSNFRAARDGNAYAMVHPGTYKRLRHEKRGCVMSNTDMEIYTNVEGYKAATGRVIINGLGLGMLLEGILSKPDVTYVRVIEIDQDVIDLVGPHFTKDKRVEIIQADAYEYRPKVGEKFDYAWHDIWDAISSDNLVLMAALGRRYNKRVAAAQGFWAREQIRADQRRYR
jgi:hypothetical protein